jgi:cytochrome c
MVKILRTSVVAAAMLLVATVAWAQGPCRYGGMGPMMGPGMMHRYPCPANQSSQQHINKADADKLVQFVSSQGLPCMSCHGVTMAGVGPSFAGIAARYEELSDADQVLSSHIANGFGRMPPGMASPAQARVLAKLIIDLERR